MSTFYVFRSGAISPLINLCHHQLLRFGFRPMVFGVFHGKSTNTDVLEIFTKQILSKTGAKPNPTEMPPSTEAAMERCELLKKITLEMQNMSQTGATLNINNWSVTDINNYLQVSLDLKDRKTVTSIMNQMLDSKQLPSNSLIIRTFSFLCDDCADSMELVTGIIEVCQEKNLPFYATSIELEPFKAQYLWKFERYDDALHTLNSIFTTRNKTIKSLILQNYRQITYNGVTHQDEAILEKLITNALGICDKYNDPSLLTYVWSDCFFSELFRNQQRASHLFGAHETVRQAVSRDIGWFALTLIQQHNIDAIHRLIENCLASSMKREVGVCLVALFDYHYSRDDLRACSEVTNTALRLGTYVSKSQNQKLINLLLKKPKQTLQTKSVVKPTVSRFEFKF